MEVHQHPGRRAPDVVVSIGNGVVAPEPALVSDAVAQVILGVQQEIERHLEDLGDLERIRTQVQRRGDEADHRSDPVPGDGDVLVQPSEQLDPVGGEPDFLLGFAQRRRFERGVLRLGASAGKAYLSGMIVKMRGAAREQHRQPAFAANDRHQHRGRADLLGRAPQVAVARRRRLAAMRIGEAKTQPALGRGLRRGHGGRRRDHGANERASLKRSVASTSTDRMPGSHTEWPASAITR